MMITMTAALLSLLTIAAVLLLPATLLVLLAPRLRHCALFGASIVCSHPGYAPRVVHWIARCVRWFLDDALFRQKPDTIERILRLDAARLTSVEANGNLQALQAFVDAQHLYERYLVRVAMNNAERFKIRRMPHLFAGTGLVNGPHTIPAGTIIAVYYANLSEYNLQDRTSVYIVKYGKLPAHISTLKFVLDGKPCLSICPDSNGSFINHKCYHANAELAWMGDPQIYLVARTRVPVHPFEHISVSYGPGYLMYESKAARLRADDVKLGACMCNAPRRCPLNRSMHAH